MPGGKYETYSEIEEKKMAYAYFGVYKYYCKKPIRLGIDKQNQEKLLLFRRRKLTVIHLMLYPKQIVTNVIISKDKSGRILINNSFLKKVDTCTK